MIGSKKICPLMSGRLAGSPVTGSNVLTGQPAQPIMLQCVENQCAFWNEEASACSLAIVQPSYVLEFGRIYAALQTLEPPMHGPLSRIAESVEVLAGRNRK